MKSFLHYLITHLVTQPEQVVIEEQVQTAEPGSHLLLSLRVAEQDMGLVIGKSGQTIAALRTLVRLRNQLNHEYLSVTLKLEEVNGSGQAT